MANETIPCGISPVEVADTEVPESDTFSSVYSVEIPKAPRMVASSFEAACESFYKVGIVFGLSGIEVS